MVEKADITPFRRCGSATRPKLWNGAMALSYKILFGLTLARTIAKGMKIRRGPMRSGHFCFIQLLLFSITHLILFSFALDPRKNLQVCFLRMKAH